MKGLVIPVDNYKDVIQRAQFNTRAIVNLKTSMTIIYFSREYIFFLVHQTI